MGDIRGKEEEKEGRQGREEMEAKGGKMMCTYTQTHPHTHTHTHAHMHTQTSFDCNSCILQTAECMSTYRVCTCKQKLRVN